MQSLQQQLTDITDTLGKLDCASVESMDDIKNLKALTAVIDKVLVVMHDEVCKLQQLKLSSLKKISDKISDIKPLLLAAEQKFMMQYVVKPPPAVVTHIDVDVGYETRFRCTLYADKKDIAIMQYGAIMHHGVPMVVYRYGRVDFVSVSACDVTDYASTDNYHTVCCGNSTSCEYGESCKYYHDPLMWSDSQHVQKFTRTSMVKKCPYFGQASTFTEHRKQLTFDNLRTLARYCAVQTMLISIVAR